MTSSVTSRLAVVFAVGAALTLSAPAALADNNGNGNGNGHGNGNGNGHGDGHDDGHGDCYTFGADGKSKVPTENCDGAEQQGDGQGAEAGGHKKFHYKGLKPKSTGSVEGHSVVVPLGSFVVNSAGAADITVTIPKSFRGAHEIVTHAIAANGTPITLTTSIVVAAPATGTVGGVTSGQPGTLPGGGVTAGQPGTVTGGSVVPSGVTTGGVTTGQPSTVGASGGLPFTGAPLAIETGVGVGLLGLGAGAIVLGRRRRTVTTA